MSENARLTRGSIASHLVSQTLPGIIGVAAMMSIGIIDAYYIGRLGSAELAAVSFIFPINVALASLGVGVMVGVSSVVARALGATSLMLLVHPTLLPEDMAYACRVVADVCARATR